MYARLTSLLLGLSILVAPAALDFHHLRAAPADTGEPAAAESRLNGPLVLEDLPQRLVPKLPPTEAERDRVEAVSLFAAGRMYQRRRQYGRALRHYQRALRCDPEAISLVEEIILLAAGRLQRPGEAARYARRQEPEDLQQVDSRLLRRLGLHLTELGQFSAAADLYEAAVLARGGKQADGVDVLLHMEMGRLNHLADRYVTAADCFARVLDALEHPDRFGLDQQISKILLGDPGLTYRMFGEAFLLADRPDEAAAAFRNAHQHDPDEALLQFHLARVHDRQNKPQEALDALQASFQARLADQGTAPYRLLGEVLDGLGQKDELLGRLEKLHHDDPQNVPLGYFLAETYLQAEQLAKAETLYRRLLEEAPVLAGYRSLIEVYRKTGRGEALLQVLGEAVEKTGVLEALGAEAETVAGDAHLIGSLVQTARKKLQADSHELDYGTRLAVALLAMEGKQFDVAGEFFELALQSQPDRAAELLLVWGVGLLLEARAEEAVKVFRRAIDGKVLADDNPMFYHYYAGALALDGHTQQALAAAEKAVDLARIAAVEAAEEARIARRQLANAGGPSQREKAAAKAAVVAGRVASLKGDWARFRSRAGWILYRAQRYDKAIQAYRRVIDDFDSDHSSGEVRRVLREVRLALSNVYVLKEDVDQAEQWLQEVLDEFPDDVGASNDLGYLWADRDIHLARALRMIQHAVDAEPENVAYRDSLGWVFYRLGRYKEAVSELQQAVRQQKKADDGDPDPIILDHLGDAHLQAGQPQEAEQSWQRAAKAFQQQDLPEKAKAVQKKINNHQPE